MLYRLLDHKWVWKKALWMPIKKTLPAPPGSGRAPAVLESEQASLGAAIRDAESAELVVGELVQEDFYGAKTQAAFKAIKDLGEAGLTVNPVSVSERAGIALSEVNDLVDRAVGVNPAQLKTLISDIRRIGELRNVYQACVNASAQVSKDSKVEDVVALLETGLYKMDRASGGEAKDGLTVLEAVVADFLKRQKDGGGVEISTGLRDLDRALIGLRPGKMGVIAARPSMGKTALADSIRRAVVAQGFGAIQFSLEMDAEEVLERELAFQAQINLRKVMSAKDVTAEELARVSGATGAVVCGRWFIDDRTYSIGGMRRKSRIIAGRMARQGVKVGLVIIDYLQLAGDSGEDRQQSISAISRGSKLMAKELGCTVLALSQLNRSCEYREDRRPMMSDLRESGAIEQDADWIGFIYREHMYDNSFPPEETEFIIRKQRSGPTGTVRLAYAPKTVTFHDVKEVVAVNVPGVPGVQ